MKPWTLITGASSGIGRELAALFAADHHNLALVGRDESRLRETAGELRAKHGVETRVIVQDLSADSAAQNIFETLRETPISVLVNNAGAGFYGAFAESDFRQQTDMMRINLIALVQLTHLFLPAMRARREGKILNVASTAAFQPGPLVTVYYASKAFVYSFSYALAEELQGSGIAVTALCPGPTRTEFFSRGGFGSRRAPFAMDARSVAEQGYRGLMKSKRVVIPGLSNKLASVFAKLLPTRLAAKAVKRIHRAPHQVADHKT